MAPWRITAPLGFTSACPGRAPTQYMAHTSGLHGGRGAPRAPGRCEQQRQRAVSRGREAD